METGHNIKGMLIIIDQKVVHFQGSATVEVGSFIIAFPKQQIGLLEYTHIMVF